MMAPGTWTVWSESDPRWNGDGRDHAVGMFSMPVGAQEHIKKLREMLKCEPPDDLQYAYMKD